MSESNKTILAELDKRFGEAKQSLQEGVNAAQLYVAVAEAWAQECLESGMLSTHQAIKAEIKRLVRQTESYKKDHESDSPV
jgi:hypothetical protein